MAEVTAGQVVRPGRQQDFQISKEALEPGQSIGVL